MSTKNGANKPYKIALDTALNAKEFIVQGGFLKIVDTSSAGISVDIALDTNQNDAFETGLKKDASISKKDGFDKFYINSTAQVGGWVRVVISDSRGDYEVDNPGGGTIDGIAQPVITQGGNTRTTSVKGVTQAETVLAAADTGRTGIAIFNNSLTDNIEIINTGNAYGTGFPVLPQTSYADDSTDALYGIAAAGKNCDVRIISVHKV